MWAVKYYIVRKEVGLTIMEVQDCDQASFEKEYAKTIIVQEQFSMAEALVKFGKVAAEEEIRLDQDAGKPQNDVNEDEQKIRRSQKNQQKA